MGSGFRLTPRALEDLRAIGRYTLTQWGREQRNDYLRAMDRRFAWLAQNPQRGRTREDVATGYRSFPQGAHIIFYLIKPDGIDIIGVLHQSMDTSNGFPPH